MRPTVFVMVKEPRAGRVKTRLGREIGMSQAAWWYRHQTGRLLRQIRDPRWTLCLAVTPDNALGSWPRDLPRVPQGRGDLGCRMLRLLAHGPALIVGSDIPGITRGEISRALNALKGTDVVIGPADDGGYWAIGSRHPLPKGAFLGVRWSTAHALDDTVKSLRSRQIAYASTLADVDTAEDLARFRF